MGLGPLRLGSFRSLPWSTVVAVSRVFCGSVALVGGVGPAAFGVLPVIPAWFFLKGEVVSLLRHLLEIRLFWENSNGGECFVLRTVSLYH